MWKACRTELLPMFNFETLRKYFQVTQFQGGAIIVYSNSTDGGESHMASHVYIKTCYCLHFNFHRDL